MNTASPQPAEFLDALALGLPWPAQCAAPAPVATTPPGPSAEEQALGYALAKQVPAMERGFVIATSYGDITVPAGWMADRIQEHVRHVLEAELLATPEGPTA